MSFWKFRPGATESRSLIDAAADETLGKAFSFADYEQVHALAVFSAGVASGDVIIESAHDPTYAGVWHPLAAALTGASNTAKGMVADFPPGGWVRARVNTAIVGGTVTVYLNGVQVQS
jgi:hypothetical protein